jgi:Tfp pilus assembly protein PilV
MMRKVTFNGERSFTLLEVILSVVIISSALLIIARSFSLIVDSQIAISNYTTAFFLLEKKLSTLDTVQSNYRDDNYNVKEGIFDYPFSKFQWHMKEKEIFGGDLRKVFLSISWEEKGKRKEVGVTTCLITPQ